LPIDGGYSNILHIERFANFFTSACPKRSGSGRCLSIAKLLLKKKEEAMRINYFHESYKKYLV